MEGKKFYTRTAVLVGAVLLMVLTFGGLLYYTQIAVGMDEETLAAINTMTKEEPVPAARGNITDRNGNVLVGSASHYQVELELDKMGDAKAQAQTVLELLDLCDKLDQEWVDTEMPITQTAPYTFTKEDVYTYTASDGTVKDTRLGRMCKAMKWERTPNAGQLIDQMKQTFGLEETEETAARNALGVLYSCYLRKNEILWTEYAFARDVDIRYITVVKERDMDGVTIGVESVRDYRTPYAAHLLGQVGPITAENWSEGENYKERGYAMDDVVGLSGVEYAFEEQLRGQDGIHAVTVNRDGDPVSEEEVTPALAGSDVALTLDLDLQTAAEASLAQHVPQLNGGQGGAAAVVIDVKDGGVLTMANWPTFDAETMTYDDAVSSLSPLFNRALQGTYSPGSTYKPVTAAAALGSGAATPDTRIPCTGYLDYYGSKFRCWIYREQGMTHGNENVSDALRDSCNIFFYRMGIAVGIDTLNEYAQKFGLGLPTGIELKEATGVNAGPEYSEKVGATWYGGNLLSAAIGQSDNLFTPLQIANYIATLVNGGTRYSAHLLHSATAADGTVTAHQPEVLGEVDMAPEHLAAIKDGMRQMAEHSTTVSAAFARLKAAGIQVGAKTGSAQVSGQEQANGLFVCFAPYDDPQVAVCVAVEKGGSGAATSVIAADILEAYFQVSDEPEVPAEELNVTP